MDCFDKEEFPFESNKSLITLIPKIDKPENIFHFRSITLCNITYKIFTKVLVNRLRPLLDKIIGLAQASFLPGRNTTDNIVITQEIIHSLSKLKGKKGGMIIKIDLEKAYDCVNWSFLRRVLTEFNFSAKWINIIMSCVSLGSTAILWNG